jgi:SAM-dependent methyltransferase
MSSNQEPAEPTNRDIFSKIYERHDWLGSSRSGPGSDPERTVEYRKLLQQFLKEHNIRSVVDLGCGDWSSSRLVDWTGIDYIGVDVAESVVTANQACYGRSNISFRCVDATRQPLPEADLLIAKEVLQHLPIADVQTILEKAKSYPFALVVNDISHEKRSNWKGLWRWKSICPTNTEIRTGSYRLLALQEPPFSLNSKVVLTYRNQYKGLRWTKQVVLWSRR